MSAQSCTGCARPFTVARVRRFHCRPPVVVFTHPDLKATDQRVGMAVRVDLCRPCDRLRRQAGGNVFALPGVARAAEEIKALLLPRRPAGGPQ